MLYHRASQVFADTGEWHVPRTLGHSQRQLCSSGHWLFWSVCLLSLLLVLCSLPGLYFSHLTAQAQDPWLPFSSPFLSTHHSQSPLLFWLPKCWFFIFFFFPWKLHTPACYPHHLLWIIFPISVLPSHSPFPCPTFFLAISCTHWSVCPCLEALCVSFHSHHIQFWSFCIGCFASSCTISWCQQEYQ